MTDEEYDRLIERLEGYYDEVRPGLPENKNRGGTA